MIDNNDYNRRGCAQFFKVIGLICILVVIAAAVVVGLTGG